MDFKQVVEDGAVRVDSGIEITINDPDNGKPLPGPVKVTVAGNWGKLGRRGQRMFQQKLKQANLKEGELDPLDDEEWDKIDAALMTMMIPRVTAWTGVEWEGKPLECTPDNVKMLLSNPALYWFADQLYVGAAKAANFMKASSVSSAKPLETA